jgi:hypothetical protein
MKAQLSQITMKNNPTPYRNHTRSVLLSTVENLSGVTRES